MNDEKFYVEFIHETDENILIYSNGREIQLPKAGLNDFNEWDHEKGNNIAVHIAEWLVKEKGM